MNFDLEKAPALAGNWVMRTAQSKPEALLLLAAGCALLMRGTSGTNGWSGTSRASTSQNGAGHNGASRHGSSHPASGQTGGIKSAAADIGKTISSSAQDVADYAADVGDRVKAAAGEYVDGAAEMAARAGEMAGQAGRSVAENSEWMARRAQSAVQETFDRVLREQPLAVAALGLAAGAAVAIAFPRTDLEDRALGSTHEALSDAAERVGKSVMGAASSAGERLKSAAQERGLTGEGLRGLAADVADTLTEAVAGKSEQSGMGRADQSGGSDQSGKSHQYGKSGPIWQAGAVRYGRFEGQARP